MTLHEQLIQELLHGNTTRTPREEAARLEILKLRGASAEARESAKPATPKVEVQNKSK